MRVASVVSSRLIRAWMSSTYRLSWAHGRGAWHEVGTLAVAWDGEVDPPERFDPIANPLPGTTQYAVVTALREPSYRLARLARPSAGQLPRGAHDHSRA